MVLLSNNARKNVTKMSPILGIVLKKKKHEIEDFHSPCLHFCKISIRGCVSQRKPPRKKHFVPVKLSRLPTPSPQYFRLYIFYIYTTFGDTNKYNCMFKKKKIITFNSPCMRINENHLVRKKAFISCVSDIVDRQYKLKWNFLSI